MASFSRISGNPSYFVCRIINESRTSAIDGARWFQGPEEKNHVLKLERSELSYLHEQLPALQLHPLQLTLLVRVKCRLLWRLMSESDYLRNNTSPILIHYTMTHQSLAVDAFNVKDYYVQTVLEIDKIGNTDKKQIY